MVRGLLCTVKVVLGALVVLCANGDVHLIIAGLGHIALVPVWYWFLR